MIFDKMFNVGPYTGNVSAVNVNIQFQAVGNEFHLILAPQLGFGLFQSLSFTDTITVLAGVAPNLPPANFQIVAVKDQVFFSAVARSAGSLTVQNTPGPTYNLSAGNELGGPTAITPTNSVTTVATLTGGNPGLSSLELDYVQANTAVPEPASAGFIGLALLALFAGIRIVGARTAVVNLARRSPTNPRPSDRVLPRNAYCGATGSRAVAHPAYYDPKTSSRIACKIRLTHGRELFLQTGDPSNNSFHDVPIRT